MLVNNPVRMNSQCKLVTTTIIAKEKHVVKRHVKLSKTYRVAKLFVSVNDVRNFPDNFTAVVCNEAAGLKKETSQV